MRRHSERLAEQARLHAWLAEWHGQLVGRRRFMLQMAGGTAAALFPWAAGAEASSTPELDEAARWQVLDAVQQHLFPTEPDAPGAHEIKALEYLKFIVADDSQDSEHRAFILQGAGWLEDMARQLASSSFLALDEERREEVMRKVERLAVVRSPSPWQTRAARSWCWKKAPGSPRQTSTKTSSPVAGAASTPPS